MVPQSYRDAECQEDELLLLVWPPSCIAPVTSASVPWRCAAYCLPELAAHSLAKIQTCFKTVSVEVGASGAVRRLCLMSKRRIARLPRVAREPRLDQASSRPGVGSPPSSLGVARPRAP